MTEQNENNLTLGAKVVLTIQDTAAITGLSVGYLYRLTSNREIPHYKRGNRLYFKRDEIENWLTGYSVPTREQIKSKAELYCHTH